jgi:hypothetical protein
MIAWDAVQSWSVLLSFQDIETRDSTGRLLARVFRQVQPSATWRDHFGFSRRTSGPPKVYESIQAIAKPAPDQFSLASTLGISWQLRDILSSSYNATADAWISPSIYKSRMLPMPASLARYVTIFYASSLVRYRPSMFDSQSLPQNAYLFDAVARECALPLLTDALTGLEGRPQVFYAEDALRL